MRAEIIGVGTEILLGQIANTNAQTISRRLAEIGVDVLHHRVVGDNVGRIAQAFREAMSRSEVVVATGGLGPTGDDVTREGVAEALDVDLVYVDEIEAFLRGKFERIKLDMPESNLRQAWVPRGARYILPERGTAPGLIVEREGRRVYVVPGVPAEMEEMLEGTIVPELAELAGGMTIVSRVIKVVGKPEAAVAESLQDLFDGLENPTVAFLATLGEVHVRLTAKAPSRDEAETLIAPVEREVRDRLGPAVYGTDEELLEEVVGRLLRELDLRLGCAESLTGGGLGARITAVAGASDYFAGSAAAYSNEAKRELLGVSEETLGGPGAVSEECALEMARGARKVFGADVGVALTGVAGPEEVEGKPRGTIWAAVSGDDGELARTFVVPGDRARVRGWAAQAGLTLLRRYLMAG